MIRHITERKNKSCAFGNLILKHSFFCHNLRQGQQVSYKARVNWYLMLLYRLNFYLLDFSKKETDKGIKRNSAIRFKLYEVLIKIHNALWNEMRYISRIFLYITPNLFDNLWNQWNEDKSSSSAIQMPSRRGNIELKLPAGSLCVYRCRQNHSI